MNRQKSLSRVSSRSLSKIKNKIQLAFSKPQPTQQQPQTDPPRMGPRSNSVRSLATSKYQASQNTLPFAIALKTGLIQPEQRNAKRPLHGKPSDSAFDHSQNIKFKSSRLEQPHNFIHCRNNLENERIRGFACYSSQGKQMVTQQKRDQGKLLRYFAFKEPKNAKPVLKVVAAIEEDMVFAGSKEWMLVSSNKKGLIGKEETSRASLRDCEFMLVLSAFLLGRCNLSRLLGDFYDLFQDGVQDLDVVVNIIGRKLIEMLQKSGSDLQQDFALLVLLVENRLQLISRGEKGHPRKGSGRG